MFGKQTHLGVLHQQQVYLGSFLELSSAATSVQGGDFPMTGTQETRNSIFNITNYKWLGH